ncbi:MAG: transglycosylase domain-containing protein, partial [Ktedonobacterales bacterium]
RVVLPDAITEKLAAQPYRRSRARMVASKWRRGRVPANPLLVIGGMLGGMFLIFVTIFAGGAGFLYAYNYYQYHQADILAIANLKNQSSSTIYDRNCFPLYTVHNDQGFQIYTPLSQISQKVQWATIDTEDRTFYSNVGIDFQGTLRAVTVDLKSGASTQGASTITQQLVKNIVLHDSTKAYTRKINEAILAFGVTQNYTKAQILEMYLDTIPYGDQNQGIEAAARNFFGLEPATVNGQYELANQQLSWGQAALLAGLPNAPSLYLPIQFTCAKAPCQQSQWDDPFIPGQECQTNGFIPNFGPDWYLVRGHEWLVYCRASAVLNNLATYGLPASAGTFTQADVQPALDEVKNILVNQQIYHWAGQSNGSATNEGIKRAPHFVDYVVQQLADQWGITDLETGGYKIYTTLDYNLQAEAEVTIDHYINQPYTEPYYACDGPAASGGNCDPNKPGPYNFVPLNNPNNGNAHNGALVAIDQYTGDILAMVGSVDYNSKDPHILGSNNITTSPYRSMGSSTKPLVYSTAFQMGWNPGIMLQDEPICFPVNISTPGQPPVVDPVAPACKGWYVPHDYNSNNFAGTFPLRRQFDESLNIGATEAMSFVGDGPSTSAGFLDMAQRLGVTTLTANAMGPTTVLGTQDIPLLQLTSAYGTFANLGKRAPERSILRIEKNDGTVLYPTANTPATPPTYQAISPQAAYMITNVLTDNFARYPEFKISNPLVLDGKYANLAITGKTGTSSGNTGPLDIVTMGYTPYLT